MMTEQLESEMREMCNLSVGVMEQGMKRGIAQGMEQGIERGEARFAELTKKLMEQNCANVLTLNYMCGENENQFYINIARYAILIYIS